MIISKKQFGVTENYPATVIVKHRFNFNGLYFVLWLIFYFKSQAIWNEYLKWNLQRYSQSYDDDRKWTENYLCIFPLILTVQSTWGVSGCGNK